MSAPSTVRTSALGWPAWVPSTVAAAAALVAGAVAIGLVLPALEDQTRRTLAITILALGLWGAYPQHAFRPSISVMALLVASQALAAPQDVGSRVLGLYGASGVWTPLTGFVLAHAIAETGLARRIAVGVVRRLGRRPSLVVLAVGVVSVLVAPLSPSTTAKALMLGSAISATRAFDPIVAGSLRFVSGSCRCTGHRAQAASAVPSCCSPPQPTTSARRCSSRRRSRT
jgi:di/tricarboxylate transporter